MQQHLILIKHKTDKIHDKNHKLVNIQKRMMKMIPLILMGKQNSLCTILIKYNSKYNNSFAQEKGIFNTLIKET
jgi:hypothetical protein